MIICGESFGEEVAETSRDVLLDFLEDDGGSVVATVRLVPHD